MKAVPDMVVERLGDVAHALGLRGAEDALDAGLTIARTQPGWTFVALPAPVVAAPAVVAAWRSAPAAVWSSRALTIAGVGVAHEVRGIGATRWQQVTDGARQLKVSAIVDRTGSERNTLSERTSVSRDSLVRPRLLGGLAFSAGAADDLPWRGFGDAWFFLPRWTYVHDGMRAALVLAVDARDAQHAMRWRDELAAFRAALQTHFVPRPQPPLITIDPGDRDAWRAQVRAITGAIARGECAKIVAARSAVVTLAGEARAADMLAELDARHDDCVRVLLHPPGGGTLIAATPERLVKLDGGNVACDALAGSLARGSRIEDAVANTRVLVDRMRSDEAMLLASAKDRREHDLVVRAIASALHTFGADIAMPDAPGVRTLRHVLHLHTPIAAPLHSPRHVLELAAALHPTPAVGGTPTTLATEWIAAHEATPRGWYAAPVGWFDLDGNGELAVAIRSGLLAGARAHLWAGAGIVAGSDPDRELAETDLKLRAMLGALGVSA